MMKIDKWAREEGSENSHVSAECITAAQRLVEEKPHNNILKQ